MKRLSLVLIFFLFFATIEASASCCNSCCLPPICRFLGVYVPDFKCGYKLNLGVLYLRPTFHQTDFAVTTSGGDFIFHSINPAYDLGYELGIGYDFPCTGNDVRLNFNQLQEGESERKDRGALLESAVIDVPTLPLITDTVIALQFPFDTATATGSLINPRRISFIEGTTHSKQNKIDLEFSQNIHVTHDLRLRFVGGLRGVNLENNFSTVLGQDILGNQTALLTGTIDVPTFPGPLAFVEVVGLSDVSLRFRRHLQEKSNFLGVGPRLGLDANYYLDIGFSLFASMSTSALVGEIDSSSNQDTRFEFIGTVTNAFVVSQDPAIILLPTLSAGDRFSENTFIERRVKSPKKARIVPNLEAKLGLSYTPCLPCVYGHVYIEGGFMVTHYFNAYDKITDTVTNPPISSEETSDVAYDGLYLKVGVQI